MNLASGKRPVTAAATEDETTGFEGRGHFLAPHAWQIASKTRIVISTGRGGSVLWKAVRVGDNNPFQNSQLRPTRQHIRRQGVNGTG